MAHLVGYIVAAVRGRVRDLFHNLIRRRQPDQPQEIPLEDLQAPNPVQGSEDDEEWVPGEDENGMTMMEMFGLPNRSTTTMDSDVRPAHSITSLV